jgi:hypothetical protein
LFCIYLVRKDSYVIHILSLSVSLCLFHVLCQLSQFVQQIWSSIHLSIDRHLVHSHTLAVINNVAMDVGMQTFLKSWFHYLQIHTDGIAEHMNCHVQKFYLPCFFIAGSVNY